VEASSLLALFDEDRRNPTGPASFGDGWAREENEYDSTLIWSNLPGEAIESVIAEQIDWAKKSGKPFEWKFYSHDGPEDLEARLLQAGLTREREETVMALPLSTRLDWFEDRSHDVQTVADEAGVDHYRQVSEAVFRRTFNQTASELLRDLREGLRQNVAFVAYDGGVPVGCARLYPAPDRNFGGMYGGGVLESHRGRGFYRALLAARIRYALAAGTKNVFVDALPTSRPILERIGFIPITRTTPFVWKG
jgi:GNAT superfamily N-acetyltransferase